MIGFLVLMINYNSESMVLQDNNPNGSSELSLLMRNMQKYTNRAKAGLKNGDRKSTRLNSSHIPLSRMPSSA